MTAKNYRAIAEELRLARAQAEAHHHSSAAGETTLAAGELGMLDNIVGRLADVLAADNARFDRGRFLAATGNRAYQVAA